jgi:hypothetical protein
VRLVRLRDGGATKQAPEAAVLFEAKPNIEPRKNAHFAVRDCRFAGKYSNKDGAVAFTPTGRGPDMVFTGMSPPMQ